MTWFQSSFSVIRSAVFSVRSVPFSCEKARNIADGSCYQTWKSGCYSQLPSFFFCAVTNILFLTFLRQHRSSGLKLLQSTSRSGPQHKRWADGAWACALFLFHTVWTSFPVWTKHTKTGWCTLTWLGVCWAASWKHRRGRHLRTNWAVQAGWTLSGELLVSLTPSQLPSLYSWLKRISNAWAHFGQCYKNLLLHLQT